MGDSLKETVKRGIIAYACHRKSESTKTFRALLEAYENQIKEELYNKIEHLTYKKWH